VILNSDDSFAYLGNEKLGFITFIPVNLDFREMTLRIRDRKWDTVRFFSSVDSVSLRVKEFFMDWFYTGFPKSLLSSFMATYSPVQHVITKNGIMFYGKNYRGNDSASLNINGTQIEIESTVPAPIDVFRKLVDDLHPYEKSVFDCRLPFHRRSFYASGKHGDWYEDERISRMTWENAPRDIGIRIGNLPLSASSAGRYGNEEFHRIIVLESDCFNNVSWIDFCTYPNRIEHSHYNMRKEGYLFDSFIMQEDRKYAFRKNSGPALYQFYNSGHLYTISLSPGISIPEMDHMISMEDQIIETCSEIFMPFW
jgi:hypothetical protein